MNRAAGAAHARMTDRLLLGNKPAPEACECDQSQALQRQIFDAKTYLVAAIVRQAEIASSPTSAAGLVMADMRMALSVLENGDE
jgi:hypothetical protein